MKNAILGIYILCVLILTGCINDAPIDNRFPTPDPTPSSGTDGELQYLDLPGCFALSLDLGKPSSSRAESVTPDLVDGDEDEYALAPGAYHYLLLYKDDTSNPLVCPLEIGETKKSEESNITVIVKSAAKLENSELPDNIITKENFLDYIKDMKPYVILNIESSVADLRTTKQQDLIKKTTGTYSMTVDGKTYFTMTTSRYVDGSSVVFGAQLVNNVDRIYDSSQQALTGDPLITAWVERVATKYTLDYGSLYLSDSKVKNNAFTLDFYERLDLTNTSQGYEIISSPKKVSYKFLGYGVDGLEKDSYLFKNIQNSNYYDGWNQQANKRCYWAEDQHYLINRETLSGYPHQFRKGLETDTVRAYHGGLYEDNKINTESVAPGYYLDYISFEALTGGLNSPGNYPSKIFSHENTYTDSDNLSTSRLWKYGYFSAGTFLVVGCQLLVDNIVKDLYRDQNDIFYEEKSQLLEAKLEILNKVILPGGNSGLRILRTDWMGHQPETSTEDTSTEDTSTADDLYIQSWNAGSVLWKGEKVADKTDLDLIPAEISGGDGQNLVAPADKSATYYLAPKNEDDTRNTNLSVTINYNHLVSLFHKIIGPIDHFYNGYMYYAAPITHSVKSPDNASWKTTGDIGVVRNNWYNIEVKGITTVGRSVDDPTQPIIPMLDVRRDYLNLNVLVIPMHYLYQDVPLSPGLNNN